MFVPPCLVFKKKILALQKLLCWFSHQDSGTFSQSSLCPLKMLFPNCYVDGYASLPGPSELPTVIGMCLLIGQPKPVCLGQWVPNRFCTETPFLGVFS